MKITELNDRELTQIYGGSEASYKLGRKIGYFIGSFCANTLKAMDALADGAKEAIQAISVLK